MTAKSEVEKFDEKKDEEENLGKTKLGTCQKFIIMMNMMVFLGEIMSVFVNGALMYVAVEMIISPVKKHIMEHALDRFAYRAFWGMQGGLLFWLCLTVTLSNIWCGLLNKSVADLPKCLKPRMVMGFFQYELGRALFLILVGFYVYTVMSAYATTHVVPHHLWWICKVVGVMSLSLGVFMLIFDVCFDCLEAPKFHPRGGRRQDPSSFTDMEMGTYAMTIAMQAAKPDEQRQILIAQEMKG